MRYLLVILAFLVITMLSCSKQDFYESADMAPAVQVAHPESFDKMRDTVIIPIQPRVNGMAIN